MKKIGFVIPWFAENIPGGAEAALRGLTQNLCRAGVALEILTTCVKESSADWNINYYPEGTELIGHIPVRRFKVRKRDEEKFNLAMSNIYHSRDYSLQDEDMFLNEMINSSDLYRYMQEHEDEYEFFVFTPYLFGTTYHGILASPDKAVMIPCLHDEPFAYLQRFKELFQKVRGMAFLAQPEFDLACSLYDLKKVETQVLGTGINTNFIGNKNDFIEKYKIKDPFILYAGRKEKGKNIDLLLEYFEEYKKRNDNNLKMVLVGGGEIGISPNIAEDVYDLGYVPEQDKYNAYAASLVLCQPSKFESFSIVIMESWLCRRPVLVYEPCKVTTHFAKEVMGGLYFNNYFEFEGCMNYLQENEKVADMMGENGREYVLNNFAWDVVVSRYKDFFQKVIDNQP